MLRFNSCYFMIMAFSLSVANAVELPNQVKIGGATLSLNGAGVRTKTFVQIYESGLYLTTPSTDAKAIIAADQLMAIRIRITSGFVSRSALLKSFTEGLEKATDGKTDEIKAEAKAFADTLQEEVQKNDVFDFVHVPAKGLCVLKNGQFKGVVPNLEFKKALFGIWLSERPADAKLRQAMLGTAVR